MEWSLALVAVALLGVAAISRRLPGTPITPAMLFVAFGLLVGPNALDGIDVAGTSSAVRALAEATLALVLFSDAARIDLGALRRAADVPVRLLGIGLPLTILLGAVAATLVLPELDVAEAFILAIALAPTDAALGQVVVTEPRVPRRSPGGTCLATASQDNTARVWRVSSLEVVAMLRVDAPLSDGAWSPRGDAIALAGARGIYVFAYESESPDPDPGGARPLAGVSAP